MNEKIIARGLIFSVISALYVNYECEDKNEFLEEIEKKLQKFDYEVCSSFEFEELLSGEIIDVDIVDHEKFGMIAEIQ